MNQEDGWRVNKQAEGRFQHDVRKAWLKQGGKDKPTILDLLLHTEVRGLIRDLSMAEVLEKTAYYNQEPPTGLEWYEKLYLDFVTAFAVQWISKENKPPKGAGDGA